MSGSIPEATFGELKKLLVIRPKELPAKLHKNNVKKKKKKFPGVDVRPIIQYTMSAFSNGMTIK
jgi:hypothetical protein